MATGEFRGEEALTMDSLRLEPLDYRAGTCNIGPAEIARRRRSGYVAAGASAALLGALVALRAPRSARLLVAVPATVSAAGFLQARLRFCARFGALGRYNFGELGEEREVADASAAAADRVQAFRIGAASAAIGGAVALGAVLLPVR